MDQVIYLIKLRLLLTFRTYTRTITNRVESFFFFPLFFLAMVNMYIFLPLVLWQTLIFPAAPVMIFIIFFLGLTFMWISVPLMGFRLNESLDMKKILHFPIPFWKLYFSLTIGNFLDVSSIVPITFLAGLLNFCRLTGEAAGFTGSLLVCLVFFVFIQLLHQLVILIVYSILPRINPMKIMGLILVAIVAFMIILNLGIVKVPEEFSIFNDENIKYHVYFPHAYFGVSLYEFWAGNTDLGWQFLFKCILWVLPLFLINGILMLLTYQGVELGILRSKTVPKKARHAAGGIDNFWRRFGARPEIIITLISSRNLLRDWHFIFYKMMPGIVTPTLILLIIKYHFTQYSFERDDPLFRIFIFAFIILIIMLFLAQAFIFVGNVFGYDREAITTIFTVPVSEITMLLGKNILMFLLLTVDALVISFLTALFFPHIFIQMTFFVFMECLILILIGLGNFSSLIYPYHVPLDKPTVSFQGTLIVAVLSMFTDLVLFVLIAPIASGLYYLLKLNMSFWLIPAYMASLGYSIALYILFLHASAKLMPRYRESIFQNVKSP